MASISFPSSSSSSSSFCVVNLTPFSTIPPHLSNPPPNSTVKFWAHHHDTRRKTSVCVSSLPSTLTTFTVSPYYHSKTSKIKLNHVNFKPISVNCFSEIPAVSKTHSKISKTKLTHVNFRPYSVNCINGRQAESETQMGSSYNPKIKLIHGNFRPNSVNCLSERSAESETQVGSAGVDCVGTGLDVECVVTTSSSSSEADGFLERSTMEVKEGSDSLMVELWQWALLISPFFFWGTAMVAMKEVLPKTGVFFISAFRLIPAGLLLVAFAVSRGRKFPSGLTAWLSISLFALVDATCFQGFLAEGLEKTSAGLGSVIIDSQPLTVAVLAALLFGESIGLVGAAGLVLGVVGLLLLEVPALAFDESNFSLWGSGEWWMLLAAQSMAVGTVMVRWVSKYSDPVMATGWHMVIGGLPLAVVSILNHDPVLSGSFKELTTNDLLALLYTSIFGSAVSYGVFFYNATRGSLTKLSSLTFLTPMFASIFGFLYLGETFSSVQLVGAVVTVGAIYMVNYKSSE